MWTTTRASFFTRLATRYAFLSLLFVATGFTPTIAQEECLGGYDPSLAQKIGKQYRAALKARDYARLKELKREREQLDLWAKTGKSCQPQTAQSGDGGPSTDSSGAESNSGDSSSGSNNSDTADTGNQTQCSESDDAEANCTDDDCDRLARTVRYAEAASCSYEPATCSDVGYDRVLPADIGMNEEDFHEGSFDAELLIDSETGEPMLVFRGTDDTLDWLDNVGQGVGFTTDQYEKAIILARQLNERFPGRLTIAGHSLGGGLATAAALSIGAQANVFNPAGLTENVAENNSLDIDSADALIDIYHVDGEVLTSAQDFELPLPFTDRTVSAASAPGERFPLNAPDQDWIDENFEESEDSGWIPNFIEGPIDDGIDALRRSVLLHGMDAVMESLNQEQERLGCI